MFLFLDLLHVAGRVEKEQDVMLDSYFLLFFLLPAQQYLLKRGKMTEEDTVLHQYSTQSLS